METENQAMEEVKAEAKLKFTNYLETEFNQRIYFCHSKEQKISFIEKEVARFASIENEWKDFRNATYFSEESDYNGKDKQWKLLDDAKKAHDRGRVKEYWYAFYSIDFLNKELAQLKESAPQRPKEGEKIEWKAAKNILPTLFYDLKEQGYIEASDESLISFLLDNFLQDGKPFSESSIRTIFNKSKNPEKRSQKNLIQIAPLPEKGKKQS